MIPFLRNVAQVYFKTYGQKVSEFTFVFPNRRAGIFFQKFLAEAADRPVFSPEILTVADLFSRLSDYKAADRIELLFTLYDAYKQISASTETFDEFLYWGEMVLNDFDDVDKYMADAKQLFRNIYDLKEIDSGFSFLTEEQIAAIRRFWSNFLPTGSSQHKKEFIEMWEVLYELYILLRNTIALKGLAYEGMIFRDVAEKARSKEEFEIPFSKLVFVGLNAHSKSEEVLLRYLQQQGKADFYWDYSSELVKDRENRASAFVEKNKMLFPSQLPLEAEDITFDLPLVEAVGIPSAVGQAKFVHKIIKSLIDDKLICSDEDALKTAVILPDENLLLPTLYSIPTEINKINVTMGYNLSNSSVSGLMDHIFSIQRNIRTTSDGETGFYHRFVQAILGHKYIISIAGDTARSIRAEIVQNNLSVVPLSMLKGHAVIELIFYPVNHWADISTYLKNILAQIQGSLYAQSINDAESSEQVDTRSSDLEREFIIEYYKTINKMEEALGRVEADMKPDTYFKLLKKLVSGISVPFTGEPLSGLQIMGMLETRALDFENLIILSMNEGVFPQRKPASSFIPYNLRQGFGLPTYEHQDAIFSYHFYRLINRAKRIYILYDTRTEGLQTGEVSRYFNQLKFLYANKFDIKEKLAVYEISSVESETISIEKDTNIQKKLEVFSTGERSLSASAINMYLNCPLQFYFSVVEELKEEEEISETVEASTFGSIFHLVMEWLYEPFEGKMVTADLLHRIRKDDALLTKCIERSFAKNYFKTDPNKARKLTGQNYLTGEVLRKYIKKVLKIDAKLTPFIYQQSEKRLNMSYDLPSGRKVSLKGFIDRIDEVSARTRIIDYKTGKGVLRYKSMGQLFDKEVKDRPTAVMQVLMYAHLYLLENPEKVIEPGIYFLRSLFDEKFDADVIFKPSARESYRMEDFSEYKDEFKEHFDACLEEIFDTNAKFHQTLTGKACEWCAFTSICKK